MKKLQLLIVTILLLSIIFPFPIVGQSNIDLAVDLTKYLPYNYVKDGSTDYTQYIQEGLKKHRNVKLPNFPILINEQGLIIHSNSRVFFQPKSQLIMQPNNLENFSVIWIKDVENVIIYKANIIGDRDEHLVKTGEWGMGIHISNSKNIKIESPTIRNCWGDGIYIGAGKFPNNDILIDNAFIENCRRNGISITNGVNIIINDSKIAKTNGTHPQSGLDIEPNNSNDEINNIIIKNLITFENANYGMLLALNNIASTSKSKKCNIKIYNHKDEKSKVALRIAYANKENRKRLSGLIEFNNSTWVDNQRFYIIQDIKLLPKIKFNNLSIIKKEDVFKNDYTTNRKSASYEELDKMKIDLKSKKNILFN